MFRRFLDITGRKSISWALVAAWSVVIFLTIPFARLIQGFFEHLLGSHLYLTAAALAGVFFVLVALIYILQRRKSRIPLRIAWMAALGAVSVWIMRNQLQTPAEAIHFFEYSILSFFFFRAWHHHVRDPLIYPVALLSVVIVASADEFLQWLTPGRYWDFRDIRLNLAAGAVIQLFIALVIHPSGIEAPVARRSVRWLCRMSWLTLILFGLAISNTPARVDLYAARIPFLRFLSNHESVMTEYGHRHEDPEIGVFYSRFTLPELAAIDRERGARAGDMLRRYHALLDYQEFLQMFTSSVDPFLHEMRVHLFRRDHYYNVCWKYQQTDPERFVHHITVAVRENQILEKYFSNALRASGHAWTADKLQQSRAFADTGMLFASEVSDHLVTFTTEMELWFVILLLSLIMVWVYVRYGRRVPAGSIRT